MKKKYFIYSSLILSESYCNFINLPLCYTKRALLEGGGNSTIIPNGTKENQRTRHILHSFIPQVIIKQSLFSSGVF